MLRISKLNLGKLSNEEGEVVLNACLAAAEQRIEDAVKTLRGKLAKDQWIVHEGGHHIAILRVGQEQDSAIQLIDLCDSYLSMLGFPDYLCQERLALGIGLKGVGY
jgi:hypothetical protein